MDQFFTWLAQYDANFAQSLYFFVQRFPRAALITVQVTAGSCLIAFFGGFLLALCEMSGSRGVARFARAVESVGQGIPLPPLVFLIYFTALSFVPISPALAATVAIGIFTTPYATAVFRAGIRSVPNGQIEVADSLGMLPSIKVRRVILPNALRVVLPSLGHLAIVTLLNSSFASVIGATDITGMSRNIINANFSTMMWIVVGAVYFIISFPLSRLLIYFESRAKG